MPNLLVSSVDVGPVLHYAAEMSEVLAFLVVLPGACTPGASGAGVPAPRR